MAAITGRKVNKDIIYSLDGQPITEDVQPLKMVLPPQLIVKKQKKQQPKETTTTTPKNVNKTTTKQQQSTTKTVIPMQISNAPIKDAKENQQKPVTPTQTREPRVFKPLSEQFPNLMSTIYNQKEFNEDSPSEDGSSDDDAQSQSSYEENQYQKPPSPQKNPQTQRKVEQIVKQNNKKFIDDKRHQKHLKDEERAKKLHQRELMKQYGKQQIVRAHTSQECFENQYSWGQNQARVKEDQDKQQKLREDKSQPPVQQQPLKPKVDLSTLFPNAEGRTSKYKEIWKQEAIKSSKKENYSLSAKRHQVSPPKVPKESKVDIEKFKAKVKVDAQKALETLRQERQKKRDEVLLKKHKISYIDREAKAILKKTKKTPFQPKDTFDNLKQASRVQYKDRRETDELNGVQELFQEAENEAEDFSEKPQMQYHQRKVKNGKVISNREFNNFKEDQKQKSGKIKEVKSSLKKQKYIGLKNVEQYSEKELKVKQQVQQQIDLEQSVSKKSGIKPNKTSIELAPNLTEFIFQEAELPKFDGEYEVEQRMDFRQQVEQEIREQVMRVKKKKVVTESKVGKLSSQQMQQANKPQPRDKPIYRSQNKFVNQPRYPVYHDLGDVCMLDDDIYQAQHSGWNPIGVPQIPISDSDSDNVPKINKHTIPGKSRKQNNLTSHISITKSKSVDPKNRSVHFREPQKPSDQHVPYLTDQKEQLRRIVEQQKLRNHQTSDDDSDDGQILQYANQIWLPTDPMMRDVFIMSSKELMELAVINV